MCTVSSSAFAVKFFSKLVVHLFCFRELLKKSLRKSVSKSGVIILYNCLIALLLMVARLKTLLLAFLHCYPDVINLHH